MRALILEDGTPRLDTTRRDPQPAAGEVLIRPTRMGICATDLALCRGYMGFEGVLGHEFVGTVTAAADPEHRHWIDRRVCGRINCACGACDMCHGGLPEHCRHRTVLGIVGRDGCFADAFTLPAVNLHAVPDPIPDDDAVFIEPLAAACQIVRQIPIEGRPYITVLGDGRLGLLCAQVLSPLNATVRCVGRHQAKLAHCERWGVKTRLLDEVGLRRDQDIVIDCTGSPTGLPIALQMVRPRGTVVMKTTVAPDAWARHPPDLAPLVIDEIHLIGSRCGPFPDAIDLLATGRIDLSGLITRRMKLADGPDALRAAAAPGALKILLKP